MSSLTTPLRFDVSRNADLSEFQTNLAPRSRIHFYRSTYALDISAEKAYHQQVPVAEIAMSGFEPVYMAVKYGPRRGKYIACRLMCRSEVALR